MENSVENVLFPPLRRGRLGGSTGPKEKLIGAVTAKPGPPAQGKNAEAEDVRIIIFGATACHRFAVLSTSTPLRADTKRIEVAVRPRKRFGRSLLRCHLRAPGTTRLAQKALWFIPCGGFSSSFVTPCGGFRTVAAAALWMFEEVTFLPGATANAHDPSLHALSSPLGAATVRKETAEAFSTSGTRSSTRWKHVVTSGGARVQDQIDAIASMRIPICQGPQVRESVYQTDLEVTRLTLVGRERTESIRDFSPSSATNWLRRLCSSDSDMWEPLPKSEWRGVHYGRRVPAPAFVVPGCVYRARIMGPTVRGVPPRQQVRSRFPRGGLADGGPPTFSNALRLAHIGSCVDMVVSRLSCPAS